MEFEIFEIIKEAFETSTHSNNRFLKALKSVKWEAEFTAGNSHIHNPVFKPV